MIEFPYSVMKMMSNSLSNFCMDIESNPVTPFYDQNFMKQMDSDEVSVLKQALYKMRLLDGDNLIG